ncbi:hypothetical protein WG66_009472 [Moniliophthora roreri]|nr:hypothetical protein WG66_009472 [Moniliophthora roreri]
MVGKTKIPAAAKFLSGPPTTVSFEQRSAVQFEAQISAMATLSGYLVLFMTSSPNLDLLGRSRISTMAISPRKLPYSTRATSRLFPSTNSSEDFIHEAMGR